MNSEEAKAKIALVMPYLRDAVAEAKKEGRPAIGILAVSPTGGGRIIAQFHGEEFIDDLCAALGLPAENTEDEQLDVAAEKIVQMVRDAGGTIVSTPLDTSGLAPKDGNG